MGATIPFPSSSQRLARERELRGFHPGLDRRTRSVVAAPTADEHRWLVDLHALARCRALFAGRTGDANSTAVGQANPRQKILMDVPPAYDQFCQVHFASVKRIHPELTWEDACPAYAVALSAHASLHVALDDAREKQLEESWDRICGDSSLAWKQARPLIADGCSALDRLDPLAMRR